MVRYMRRRQPKRYNRRAVGPRYPRSNLPKTIGDYTVSDVANAAWSGVQYIKKLVNSEKHHADVTSIGTITATTGLVVEMNLIGTGDTISTRTGNSILVTGIHFRAHLTLHTSNVNTMFRLIVVQDKQQIADTKPAWADLLEDDDAPNSMYDLAVLGRFKILKDEFFTMNAADSTSRAIDWKLPLETHVRYNGSASTDVQKNGIYVAILHNEPTNLPSWNFYGTTHFYDN